MTERTNTFVLISYVALRAEALGLTIPRWALANLKNRVEDECRYPANARRMQDELGLLMQRMADDPTFRPNMQEHTQAQHYWYEQMSK